LAQTSAWISSAALRQLRAWSASPRISEQVGLLRPTSSSASSPQSYR
jgi:hypothetical protein